MYVRQLDSFDLELHLDEWPFIDRASMNLRPHLKQLKLLGLACFVGIVAGALDDGLHLNFDVWPFRD